MTNSINTGSGSYRSTNMSGGPSSPSTGSANGTATPGGGIIWTPSNPINGSKSTSLGAGGIITGSTYSVSSSSNTTSFTLAGGQAKTDIQYLIVLNDGSVLEFEEVGPLTAKEMIGISKFFASIAKIGYSGISVKWSDIINSLGIQRHFKPGSGDANSYDSSGKIFYVKLIDAP